MPTPRRAATQVALAASLALSASLLTAPTAVAGPAERGSAGIGDGYFPIDGNGGINVR